MKFKLEIKLGNDAMKSARHLSAKLSAISEYILSLEEDDRDDDFAGRVISSIIRDENGNKVGTWEIL
jgi:hypothetical protein